MLERYSKENVDLQVRSRRRARRSKIAAAKQRGEINEDDEDQASEMEDVAEAERVSRERKFDFTRFAAKFMTQACVDTFVSFTKYYNDLDTDQLKRAHRFFYRVAFKQDLTVVLFRLDIIALFNKMIKGPEGLNSGGPMFAEWDQLVRQLIRRLIKKLDQRPELAIELLFSKINSTTFYLEYGYEKQTISSKPRPPATLEVRESMSIEEQIGVAVAVLYDDKLEHVDWVLKTLASAANERQSWEAEAEARKAQSQSDDIAEIVEQQDTTSKALSIVVTPDNDATRIAMFKDSKLRLLMTLASFERLGEGDEPNATWIIPSSVTSAELHHKRNIIEQHRKNPIFEYGEEDPVTAEEMLRLKPTEKARRAEYDDDSEGDGIVSDNNMEEEFLFPVGGPMKNLNPHQSALDALKKRRRKRHSVHSDDEGGLDDETREARRKARELADLEKRRKIKSHEFVRDSDNESDEEKDREFFAREEARRKGQGQKVMEALRAGMVKKTVEGEKVKPAVESGKGSKKRKNDVSGEGKRKKRRRGDSFPGESDMSEDGIGNKDSGIDVDSDTASDASSPPRKPKRAFSASSDNETAEDETPLSSPPLGGLSLSKETDAAQAEVISSQERLADDSAIALDKGDSDEDGDLPVASTSRRRGRVTVFDDSDDE